MRGCSRVAWDADAAAYIGSIPPSEKTEKTRSGYVISHKQEEKRTREKGLAGEGGRFPAQFSHFSMDTMYGIWRVFFRGS